MIKHLFVPTIVIIILSSFTTYPVDNEAKKYNNASKTDSLLRPSSHSVSSMKIKEVEKKIGRRLTLKEKIAFKMYRHGQKETGSSKGKTALIVSILSLCFFFIPFLTLASLPLAIIGVSLGSRAKKIDKTDRKAKKAITLGAISIGLFVIALIIVLITIA